MKTKKSFLRITLGVFLMSTVAFANNNDPINTKSKSELNKEYVTVVHENNSQFESKFLSGLISEYDVRNSEQFDSRKDDFKVVFKSNKGSADVIYNSEGRIVSVIKNLKNVVIPKQMVKQVTENYKGWEIVKNKYKESYIIGEDVEKSYVLTIKNGKEKKKIRLNG